VKENGRIAEITGKQEEMVSGVLVGNAFSVRYRMWDLLKATVGGEDSEKLLGAKSQVDDICYEYLHELTQEKLPRDMIESKIKEMGDLFHQLGLFLGLESVSAQMTFWDSRVNSILWKNFSTDLITILAPEE